MGSVWVMLCLLWVVHGGPVKLFYRHYERLPGKKETDQIKVAFELEEKLEPTFLKFAGFSQWPTPVPRGISVNPFFLTFKIHNIG